MTQGSFLFFFPLTFILCEVSFSSNILWISGAMPCLLTITLFWGVNYPCIYPVLSSKGWNTSQMLFYFWQLHPATPGESKTVSRPPERFSPFKVLSASPLALPPVGLPCFISTGRSQSNSLPGWTGFTYLFNLQTLLNFGASCSLPGIVPEVQRNVRLAAGICALIYLFTTWNKAQQVENRF